MVNMSTALGLGMMLSFTAQAKEIRIKTEGTFFPSPAAIHLENTQGGLAQEAAKACGGPELVEGLRDIVIQIKSGLGEGEVGILTKNSSPPAVYLIYPNIVGGATVKCRD